MAIVLVQPRQQQRQQRWYIVPIVLFVVVASISNVFFSFSEARVSLLDDNSGLLLSSSAFSSSTVDEADSTKTSRDHDESDHLQEQGRLLQKLQQNSEVTIGAVNATIFQLSKDDDKHRQENQMLRKRLDEMETRLQNHLNQDKQRGNKTRRETIPLESSKDGKTESQSHGNKAPALQSTSIALSPPRDEPAGPLAIGPVQAMKDPFQSQSRGLLKDIKELVSPLLDHDRTLHHTVAELALRRNTKFHNRTLNPTLPSAKIDSTTMYNIEILPNYSVKAPMTSTVPWSNVTTMAFWQGKFYSGYRNQIMAFTMLVMETVRQGHGQLLLTSISQKDLHGSNKQVPFSRLWDVEHWNSHYPRLPRLVDYDPVLHSQFNLHAHSFYRIEPAEENKFGTYGVFVSSNCTMRPHSFGKQNSLQSGYSRYAMKGRGPYINPKSKNNPSIGFRNPIEILMMRGAMRPHPDMQAIMNRQLSNSILMDTSTETGSDNGPATARIAKDAEEQSQETVIEYMTLHARVEPDMQKHPMCRYRKVLNLTDIFEFIEAKWPDDPPVTKIFMPINRKHLEKEGLIDESNVEPNDPNINWIAVENLKALNRARDEGLWNGRVKVIEFGANALKDTVYADRPGTAGAMLDFFTAIKAKIFIGTEVSSFSHDLLATRFFRNYKQNYKYLPDGLHDWTPPGTVDPPGFGC